MANNHTFVQTYLCSKSDKYQGMTLRYILFIPVDRELTKYYKYVLLIVCFFVYLKDNYSLSDQ